VETHASTRVESFFCEFVFSVKLHKGKIHVQEFDAGACGLSGSGFSVGSGQLESVAGTESERVAFRTGFASRME
jgi:hypothetical protein